MLEYICIAELLELLYTASFPELLAQFLATVNAAVGYQPAPTRVPPICSISLSLQPAPA